jgi:hypothetical protein
VILLSDSLTKTADRIKAFPRESREKFKQVVSELSNKTLSNELMQIIETMSDDEYNVFMEILKQASEDGESHLFNRIKAEDYDEIPVDIRTFICDPRYLGGSTNEGKLIYPYWMNVLEKIFAPNSKIIEVVLTGAIGVGKSTVAIIGMAYILYRLMCLKNPAAYYNLLEGSKIAEAIFNIDLQHVHGIGYGRLQSTLKLSPWFVSKGNLRGRNAQAVKAKIMAGEKVSQEAINECTYEPSKDISLIVGSKASHFTGYDVFCAFLDEMNFYEKGKRTTDATENFTSLEIMKVYTAIKRRIESRFMLQGVVPGLIFMISSKRAEDDALEVYANKHRNEETVLIVDEPIWVIKNMEGTYSGNTFKLLVGDKFNKTKILSDDDDISILLEQGRRILDVPVEHRRAFELNADQALTDIAGIALVSGSRFIDAMRYKELIDDSIKNIFKSDIHLTGMTVDEELIRLVDTSRIPPQYRGWQTFIHVDTSKNHDRTGISVVVRSADYREIERLEKGNIFKVRDYEYATLGVIGLQAIPGDMIPYRKILELIISLRASQLNIIAISVDTFQSLYLQQDLMDNGFKVNVVSVDRTPAAYLNFRRVVYEKRLKTIASYALEHELTELIENKQTGKIDHPIEGSKDLADSVVGAYFNASSFKSVGVSSDALARMQEDALDSQLGRDIPQNFGNAKIVSSTNIFKQLDDMLNDDFDY